MILKLMVAHIVGRKGVNLETISLFISNFFRFHGVHTSQGVMCTSEFRMCFHYYSKEAFLFRFDVNSFSRIKADHLLFPPYCLAELVSHQYTVS
jgi:hypothetical protein